MTENKNNCLVGIPYDKVPDADAKFEDAENRALEDGDIEYD